MPDDLYLGWLDIHGFHDFVFFVYPDIGLGLFDGLDLYFDYIYLEIFFDDLDGYGDDIFHPDESLD